MRPGWWLWLVLCVPFSALTVLVWWQEGHPVCETPHFTDPRNSSSGTGAEEPEGEGTSGLRSTRKNNH